METPFVPPHLNEAIFRMLSALTCGLILGLDREIRGKSAGVKTLIAVSLAASLFTLLSFYLPGFRSGTTIVDAGRIGASVVLGVGFLCSGVVMHEGNDLSKVTGLTTAAMIWLVAAFSMACAAGYPFAALSAAVLLTGLLWTLTYIEEQIVRNFHEFRCDLIADKAGLNLPDRLRTLAAQYGLKLTHLKVQPKENHLQVSVRIRGKYRNGERLLKEVSSWSSVRVFRADERYPSPPSLRD